MQLAPEIDESASNVGLSRSADCGMPVHVRPLFTSASLGTRRRRHGDDAAMVLLTTEIDESASMMERASADVDVLIIVATATKSAIVKLEPEID